MDVKRITVFIADDHAIVRAGIISLLSHEPDITVIGDCGDGREVLPNVKRLRPDVLVLDISMPGADGLAVCYEVKRCLPNTAVLILSMHGNQQYVTAAIKNGARGYLVKEAAPGLLSQAIRTVHQGRMYVKNACMTQAG